jgi:uncharacterized BrkB/YihY/UPF0761 family membrane protein
LLAGGIAYRLFLWLLPTALFLIASIGLIADLSSRSPEHVAGDAGLGAALTVTIAQAVEQSERGTIYLLFLGVVLMLWAGRSVVKALRLTSAVAWRVRPPPLTHALAASIIYTGISVGLLLSPGLLQLLHHGSLVTDVIVELLATAGLLALTVWMQSILPHPNGVPWTAFLPGAIVFSVAPPSCGSSPRCTSRIASAASTTSMARSASPRCSWVGSTSSDVCSWLSSR